MEDSLVSRELVSKGAGQGQHHRGDSCATTTDALGVEAGSCQLLSSLLLLSGVWFVFRIGSHVAQIGLETIV